MLIVNIGFWSCIILVPGFVIIGLLFAICKGNAAKFVAGFNALSEKEQEMYDKNYIARDTRNSCFLWAFIMLAGAIFSYLFTGYMAIIAYIVWGVVFFKDVHFDTYKAFEKYLIK